MLDVKDLVDKLNLLKSLDLEFKIFGSSTHHYNLLPPTHETEIKVIEESYGITLPDEYRQFIIDVGDGGAGPFYGLLSLKEALSFPNAVLLNKSFMYTNSWNDSFPSNWWDLPILEQESIIIDPNYYDISHIQGSLYLAHEGSGYYNFLVITGKERGHMWGDFRAGNGGINPLPESGDTERLSFFQWYNLWLETSLQVFNISD